MIKNISKLISQFDVDFNKLIMISARSVNYYNYNINNSMNDVVKFKQSETYGNSIGRNIYKHRIKKNKTDSEMNEFLMSIGLTKQKSNKLTKKYKETRILFKLYKTIKLDTFTKFILKNYSKIRIPTESEHNISNMVINSIVLKDYVLSQFVINVNGHRVIVLGTKNHTNKHNWTNLIYKSLKKKYVCRKLNLPKMTNIIEVYLNTNNHNGILLVYIQVINNSFSDLYKIYVNLSRSDRRKVEKFARFNKFILNSSGLYKKSPFQLTNNMIKAKNENKYINILYNVRGCKNIRRY